MGLSEFAPFVPSLSGPSEVLVRFFQSPLWPFPLYERLSQYDAPVDKQCFYTYFFSTPVLTHSTKPVFFATSLPEKATYLLRFRSRWLEKSWILGFLSINLAELLLPFVHSLLDDTVGQYIVQDFKPLYKRLVVAVLQEGTYAKAA